MYSAFQTVVRGPNLRGLGKRPSFTPCHQPDLETGIGPAGARIADRRTKPVRGKGGVGIVVHLIAIASEVMLATATEAEGDQRFPNQKGI